MTTEPAPKQIIPFDPSLLKLGEEDAKFFKTCTRIEDGEELAKHITDVAAKAYEVFSWPCIALFEFTKFKVSRLPAYQSVIKLGQERPGAILLDTACCFGNDLRKVISDGWPMENTIAIDVEPAFWGYGHELFKSTPETFPAGFIGGDIFDPSILRPRQPFYQPPATPRPQNLRTLESLTPLQGHISAICVLWFFHLYGEEKQIELAKQLASLLSPEPGSVIFGSQRGEPIKKTGDSLWGYSPMCHSPESWKELWDRVFKKGTVRVETELEEGACTV
ncbi:hypothetical protein P691DRAFT_167687 [Macrolepiota fuliginosa MF-IS2]|uniref:Uncharacterized protein n=1 Tax=Macrolepiota fuliginosa MF-IS2 TaxID=1400762 RepID=A0A9P6C2X4_9AGAR|nr:hypothetical protein P691DRAFT_167687 [Macrolepiota fuliginosa MF-IS2]